MNPFRRHQRRVSLDPSHGGWSTGRQLMVVVAAMVAGMLLVPAVAVAADKLLVVIVGPNVRDENLGAQVSQGNLHVNVANTPSVAQSGNWTVGLDAGTVVGSTPGKPFQKSIFASENTSIFVFAKITGIPGGKQLIVTHISGKLECRPGEGQPFTDCDLERIGLDRSSVTFQDRRRGFAEPTRQVSRNGVSYFFNDDYLAVLEPFVGEDAVAIGEVEGIAGSLELEILVSGYLVDA